MNIYDNLIAQVPAYQGASVNYLNQHYQAISSDADSLAVRELALLQDRARDLIRNTDVASSAMDVFCEGMGSVTVKWSKKNGKADKKTQDAWDEWATDCNSDGFGDFSTTQRVWNNERFASGEALCLLRVVDGQLRLKNIGSEYLDITYTGTDLIDGKTRYGITFSNDRPVIYWFLPSLYRAGLVSQSASYDVNGLKRIPVLASDVVHIFKRERAEQFRGITNLARVMLTLLDTDDLCSATTNKQKNAQAISWIVEQANLLTTMPIGVDRILGKESPDDPEKKLVYRANSGGVQYLNAGEKINFYQSTDIGANLGVMIKSNLQKACAALRVPYHQVTGDASSLDYSSIRAILVEFRTHIEREQHEINIPLGVKKVVKRWQEIAGLTNSGISKSVPTFELPRVYGVDELTDAKSDVLEVMSGLSTLSSKLEKRHLTYDDIRADRERIAELGIDALLNGSPASASGTGDGAGNTNNGVSTVPASKTGTVESTIGSAKPNTNSAG